MSESAEQLAEKVRRELHHIGPGTSAGQRWPGCAGCDAEIALDSLLARLAAAETERDQERDTAAANIAALRDRCQGFHARAHAAEARVEALSEALREIARREYIGETTAGLRIDSAVHGREEANAIARAALACPPQQPQKAGE